MRETHQGLEGGTMRSDRSLRTILTPRKMSELPMGIPAVHACRRTFLRQTALVALTASGGASGLAWGSTAPRASTSREAQEDATRHIPFDKMRDDVRIRLQEVVRNPTIFRRLPVEVIDCDPELYVFLLRYPEVVVNMWQLMGITKVRISRKGDFLLDTTDGAGTFSNVELVYGTRDTHVVYAKGYYEGPLLRRRINGNCVLLLQSGYTQIPSGRVLVSSQLDVFVALENVGAEFVAKTLYLLVGKTADQNFSESARFIAQVSQQAEVNQPGIQRMASRLNNVDDAVRERFTALAATVNERAALRSDVYRQPGRTAVLTDMPDETSVPVGTRTSAAPNSSRGG